MVNAKPPSAVSQQIRPDDAPVPKELMADVCWSASAEDIFRSSLLLLFSESELLDLSKVFAASSALVLRFHPTIIAVGFCPVRLAKNLHLGWFQCLVERCAKVGLCVGIWQRAFLTFKTILIRSNPLTILIGEYHASCSQWPQAQMADFLR